MRWPPQPGTSPAICYRKDCSLQKVASPFLRCKALRLHERDRDTAYSNNANKTNSLPASSGARSAVRHNCLVHPAQRDRRTEGSVQARSSSPHASAQASAKTRRAQITKQLALGRAAARRGQLRSSSGLTGRESDARRSTAFSQLLRPCSLCEVASIGK